jgi:maltooligosyltrehalose trehalohydrolase
MGTFTREGTFKAAIADLPRLKALGITTLEIMPVGQFSGEFGWGYDVAFPFAVQKSYGRPEDFKAFIDACHGHGLAVILDVVFNHFGAEGSVHQAYGPYNSEAYSSPWGPGLNFDGMDSEAVRHYFFQSAWQWLQEFRLDGLRLDSIHNIVDMSATPFLEELAHLKTQLEAQTGRSLVLIAESDKNDPRVVSRHGFNMEAQWSNDFQHNLHALLSGEQDGYYADYGTVNQMARIFERGVAYDGLYSSYRRKIHGRPFKDIPHATHVVFSQNHDQIGNRPKGDRLIENIGAEKARFAASCLLLSPFTPMLFMGEEWGEKRPFLYFVDYSDEELRRKVKDSRREEFKDFDWGAGHEMPDPAARSTFEQCILADRPEQHAGLQDYYRTLIEYSKLLRGQKATTAHAPQDNYFSVDYQNGYQAIFCFDIPDDSITAPGECLFCSRDYPKAPSHKDGALTLQPYTAYLLRPPQAR